jgi:hypothetical protein
VIGKMQIICSDSKHENIWLIVFLSVSCILSLAIISIDKTELNSDNFNYFTKSIKLYQKLDDPKGFNHQYFFEPELGKPPLFMVFSLPLFIIFGPYPDIARCTNIIYYAILIVSIYLLGETISKKSGLFAAIISIFVPQIVFSSRNYMIDMAIASITFISIYFYIKTNMFKDRKYSIIFAFIFNIGLMTRTTYLLYLLPWILMDIKHLISNFAKNAAVRGNAAIVLAITLFLSFHWYFVNFETLNYYYSKQLYWSITKSATYYLFQLGKFSFGRLFFPFAFLFMLSFLAFIKNKYKLNLIACIILPFTFLNMSPIKNVSHLLPLLPFIIICASIWIVSLKNRLISCAIFCLVILQFMHIQFISYSLISENPNPDFYLIRPRNEFEYDKLAYALIQDTKKDEKVDIVLLNNLPLFPLSYKLLASGRPNAHFVTPTKDRYINESSYNTIIMNSEYILLLGSLENAALAEDDYIPADEMTKEIASERKLKEIFSDYMHMFRPIETFYSDYYDMNCTIYKKLQTP